MTNNNTSTGPADFYGLVSSTSLQVINTFTDDHCRQLHALYQQEWWTRGRTFQDARKCVQGSQICIGLIDGNGLLQGFVRVLTDYVFKALVFDVIVASNRRGTGLGKELVSLVLNHEKLWSVEHFELYCLPEMSDFYEKQGFSRNVGQVVLMRLANW